MSFSQNLKALMEARDRMTNYQLAKELGKSQSTIANWISGATMPSEDTRVYLASFFGVDLAELDGTLPPNYLEKVMEQKRKPGPTNGRVELSGKEWELVRLFRVLPEDLQSDILAQIRGVLERRGLLPKQS